jgi:hypothetical protein
MAPCECGNEVNCTDHLGGVQKPEGRFVISWNKAKTKQSLCLPARLQCQVVSKPTHKEKLNVLWVVRFGIETKMSNVYMIDPKDARISIWIFIFFVILW